MEGYIHYDKDSQYSPEYPYPIGRWSSASQAIIDGQDPYSVILLFVSQRRDIFFPMKEFFFRGEYSQYINDAIQRLYNPIDEDIDIDSYVYPIKNVDVPSGMRVRRNVYQLRKIRDVYRQVSAFPIIEEYDVGMMKVLLDNKETDVLVYKGKNGSFLLLPYLPTSIILSNMKVGHARNRMMCTIQPMFDS